jgi:Tol biopolymer transport system component
MKLRPLILAAFVVTLIGFILHVMGAATIFVHASATSAWMHVPLAEVTTRISVASDGTQANEISIAPSISANGRFVAFRSMASNLVDADSNTCWNFIVSGTCPDIFVHDNLTGQTTRISVASNGTQANSSSDSPSISIDGRYIAFESYASNLVDDDTNNLCGEGDANCPDIFVYDRQVGQITRVSVASDGTQGNSESYDPSISADGRYVAFVSYASNLVSGDTNSCGYTTNGHCADIFVHDLQTGQTSRVSSSTNGVEGNDVSVYPSISADGRYVAFESNASNLVSSDTNTCYSYTSGHCPDIFVHDRETGQTIRVSLTSTGNQANSSSHGPSISGDGRYIAFRSSASNLVAGDTNAQDDIFVRDIQLSATTRVSAASNGTQADKTSYRPSISADGRYVAFETVATNLVSGDTNSTYDIFLRDQLTGQITLVSVASEGTQGNYGSLEASVSGDGRYVAFASEASNFVSGDTNVCNGSSNHCTDVFVRDRSSTTNA